MFIHLPCTSLFSYCYLSFKWLLGFSLSCSSDLASSEEKMLLWQDASFSLQNNYLFSAKFLHKVVKFNFVLHQISHEPYWIQIWITGHIQLMEILLWCAWIQCALKFQGLIVAQSLNISLCTLIQIFAFLSEALKIYSFS